MVKLNYVRMCVMWSRCMQMLPFSPPFVSLSFCLYFMHIILRIPCEPSHIFHNNMRIVHVIKMDFMCLCSLSQPLSLDKEIKISSGILFQLQQFGICDFCFKFVLLRWWKWHVHRPIVTVLHHCSFHLPTDAFA